VTILAWYLATEEQSQKSLHWHYLQLVENWNQVMNILQQMEKKIELWVLESHKPLSTLPVFLMKAIAVCAK
jgi:16S rRNA G527 N7-methylase RsmG